MTNRESIGYMYGCFTVLDSPARRRTIKNIWHFCAHYLMAKTLFDKAAFLQGMLDMREALKQ